MAAGAVCLKKPHPIVILLFSEVVKGHANYINNDFSTQNVSFAYYFSVANKPRYLSIWAHRYKVLLTLE